MCTAFVSTCETQASLNKVHEESRVTASYLRSPNRVWEHISVKTSAVASSLMNSHNLQCQLFALSSVPASGSRHQLFWRKQYFSGETDVNMGWWWTNGGSLGPKISHVVPNYAQALWEFTVNWKDNEEDRNRRNHPFMCISIRGLFYKLNKSCIHFPCTALHKQIFHC